MVQLTPEKISIDTLLDSVEDHSTGGLVIFLGRVRNHAEGRQVRAMDYEAFDEMALTKMAAIAATAREKWPIKKIALVHRTGHLKLGEISVAVAVACAHREEAFAACRFVIDTLKKTVPIWKKEYFEGGEDWVEGILPEG